MMRRKSLSIRVENGSLPQIVAMTPSQFFPSILPTANSRHFAIGPSGKYLLAENQFSNYIVVFKIDPATGGLTLTGQVVEVPSP
jgi:6-phosphogluconolactonase (cycloisomerase 2 family)